jgi:hypothetical protein
MAGVLGALVALTLASCSSSTPAATGKTATTAGVGDLQGKTPAQILAAATAAARKTGVAHYRLSAVEGKNSQIITGDASQTEGQQSIVQGTRHIHVLYTGGVAYVQGDAGGLSSAMGFTSAVAASYANKWIAVHSSDSLFKSIVSAVTLAGTLEQLQPTGTLTLTGTTTVAGREAIGVKGGLPGPPQSGVTGSTTLYVATSNPTVPLKLSGAANEGAQHVVESGSFTNWGKALHLVAPTTSVPFSSVPAK